MHAVRSRDGASAGIEWQQEGVGHTRLVVAGSAQLGRDVGVVCHAVMVLPVAGGVVEQFMQKLWAVYVCGLPERTTALCIAALSQGDGGASCRPTGVCLYLSHCRKLCARSTIVI